MLTAEQIDTAFIAVTGFPARAADVQVIQMLGGSIEDLADYVWDHWLGEPEDVGADEIAKKMQVALDGSPS